MVTFPLKCHFMTCSYRDLVLSYGVGSFGKIVDTPTRPPHNLQSNDTNHSSRLPTLIMRGSKTDQPSKCATKKSTHMTAMIEPWMEFATSKEVLHTVQDHTLQRDEEGVREEPRSVAQVRRMCESSVHLHRALLQTQEPQERSRRPPMVCVVL